MPMQRLPLKTPVQSSLLSLPAPLHPLHSLRNWWPCGAMIAQA
jgi:hypothetical protein